LAWCHTIGHVISYLGAILDREVGGVDGQLTQVEEAVFCFDVANHDILDLNLNVVHVQCFKSNFGLLRYCLLSELALKKSFVVKFSLEERGLFFDFIDRVLCGLAFLSRGKFGRVARPQLRE